MLPAMNDTTHLGASLPEADAAAPHAWIPSQPDLPRRRARVPALSDAYDLPGWVYFPAADRRQNPMAPPGAGLNTRAYNGADLLILSTSTPPYVATLLVGQDTSLPHGPLTQGALPRPALTWELSKPWLDKHGVDFALSVGRQAVERARLSGIDSLVCRSLPPAWARVAKAQAPELAVSITGALSAAGPTVTALVGACIAASHIGIPTRSSGDAAEQALRLALAINPAAATWVSALESTDVPMRATPTQGHFHCKHRPELHQEVN